MAHENTSVPAKAAARLDGIEPREFLPLFMRQWRWAVAIFVIVALIAIVPLSSMKPQWEAQATIRIAQVYDALTNSARPIEPLQDVLERMRVKSFLRDALKGAGVSLDADSERLLLGSARFDPVPSTGLIRIAARASTEDQARQVVTAMFEQLRSVHGELTRAVRSEAELLAAQYATELAGLREVQSNLQKAFSSASRPGVDDGPTALASIASTMERNAREIREIDRQRFLLVRRDGYQATPTEMMGRVSSDRIDGASRGLIVVFGIVMGVAAGLGGALLRDYVVRMRSQCAA